MKMRMILLALLALTSQNAAAQMNKPRLRQLAQMPTVNAVITGFGLSQTKGIFFGYEEKAPPLEEIARIRKELKGDASDAERYQDLGFLYARTKQKKASAEAHKQAVALFRQQVKEHPHDMHRLAVLGDALCVCGDTKEGEALLRRATKEAPNEWHTWVLLGKCIDNRAFRTILGDEHFHFQFADDRVMNPPVFDHKPKDEQIAAMRRLRQEARRCFDRAIELAPGEPETYSWRVCSIMSHGIIEGGLRKVQGERVNALNAFCPSSCFADTRQMARLSPNDPESVGGAVVAELLVYSRSDNSESNDRNNARGKGLTETRRDFVRWGTERLQQLTKNADKKTAARASEILAHVMLAKLEADAKPIAGLLEEGSDGPASVKDGMNLAAFCLKGLVYQYQIEQHLRRAMQLDPLRELAWDLLTQMLSDTFRVTGAVTLCEQRLKLKDNAHNRFLLANCLALKEQYGTAADHLRAGIARDEKNLDCRVGLIAMLLRRENGEALKEAGEQLDALDSRIKPGKNQARLTHFLLLRGLHAALSDHPDRAKELFRRVLKENLNERSAVDALVALGEPATLADESLAITYLRAHKAEIERKNKRPDAPVVRVDLKQGAIADEDLFFLSAFPQLRDVRLGCASITDAGLTPLLQLKRLQRVDLRASSVTEKGIAELRKAFPKLEITR